MPSTGALIGDTMQINSNPTKSSLRLVFEETGKNPSERGSEPTTQPTCDVQFGNRTRDTCTLV